MARKPSTTFEPGDEPHRCCAKSKSTQNRCRQRVVPGRRVCRYHGGLGGRPPTHGRYSKDLGRFREAYQESLNDPGLMDLRETMALLDLAVQRATRRAAQFDSPEFRSRCLDVYEEARGADTPEGVSDALNRLGTLLRDGIQEDAAFEELSKAAERLARRQEKAWSIKLDAATAINARDLTAVLSRFADIILVEAPKDAAARIIRRLDAEVLGTSKAAVGLSLGDPA